MIENENLNKQFKIAIQKIIDQGFLNNNRWMSNEKIVLDKKFGKYCDLIIAQKELVAICSNLDKKELHITSDKRDENILADFCKYVTDEDKEKSLYATVFNVPSKVAKLNKRFELNSASYLLDDISKKTPIKFVELFRYDASPCRPHPNNYDLIGYLNDESQNIYKYYFLETLPIKTPHFHFIDRRFVENKNVGNAMHCNAIDFVSLYRYIEDLSEIDKDDKSEVLNTEDFGMPYLKIRDNPELYKTEISKVSTIENVNCAIKKLNNSISGINQEQDCLIGLDAVLFDMQVLAWLHNRNFGADSGVKYNLYLLQAELEVAQKLSGETDRRILSLQHNKGHENEK